MYGEINVDIQHNYVVLISLYFEILFYFECLLHVVNISRANFLMTLSISNELLNG